MHTTEPGAIQPSRWLTVAEAAVVARICTKSLRKLIHAGKLTPHRLLRGKVVIDRHELDRLIESSTPTLRKGRGMYSRARVAQ